MTPTLIFGAIKYLANHKALISAGLIAAYLAAQGQYPEALATLAAALSGGLRKPGSPVPYTPPMPSTAPSNN